MEWSVGPCERSQPQFKPHDIKEVVAAIRAEKPSVVFAPHVETSTGIILPDDYLQQISTAVHQHGGLFVLDCIASGGGGLSSPNHVRLRLFVCVSSSSSFFLIARLVTD